MGKFEPGEAVAVPATVQPGAFPGEYLVTVSTTSGQISGFARDQDMVDIQRTIRAVVVSTTTRSLSVQMAGSYFTTNGLAEFSSDWAAQNVKVLA